MPRLLSRQKLEVEPPQQSCEDDTHLCVCQILSDTITRTLTEGPEGRLIITGESCLVQRMCRREPALRTERVWVREVVWIAKRRPLID